MIYNLYKTIRFISTKVKNIISQNMTYILMKLNRVKFGQDFISKGIPVLSIQGVYQIGQNFKINNTIASNPIGRNYRCMFIVRKDAQLLIGNNVGMSGTTIVCQKKVTIGDNVKCGGNVCIYDTDFHSLDPLDRQVVEMDKNNMRKQEVIIGDNVFIGAHATILKGVTIGNNSIIGACSVVTKSIPANEVWAGNPAKFIRKINNENR